MLSLIDMSIPVQYNKDKKGKSERLPQTLTIIGQLLNPLNLLIKNRSFRRKFIFFVFNILEN